MSGANTTTVPLNTKKKNTAARGGSHARDDCPAAAGGRPFIRFIVVVWR